jgi:cellulose synthase/poly-beta-1,6-N-acetylglucosamine synthase-like glycosyltransferase
LEQSLNILAGILVAIPLVVASYSYFVYPLLLWILSRSTNEETTDRGSTLPIVSVVIPAYNEEKQIAGAIDAVLRQDYPSERLQILILSDASTDATDRIVGEYSAQKVELLRMPRRSGKTKAENISCASLRGEIIVNTDASVRLHREAIRHLVTRMADPGVGVVSSRDVSLSPSGTSVNITEAGYVDYEMRIRDLETITGGIVGASGSCYAIRADLHKIPVRDDLSRDFSAALTARLHGFRAVSARDAICFIPRTASLRSEYRRKVRTISRGIDTLFSRRELLDPSRYGLFAWKLFSHKVCRWLLPVCIVAGIVGLLLLAPSQLWARLILVTGGVLAIIAIAGALWPPNRPMPAPISLVAFGVAANLAVLNALWRVVVGHHDHVWEPTRRSA